MGTLVCDTNGSAGGGNSVLVSTPLVPLSPQGEADFNGDLGPLPAACMSEPDIAFLVRSVTGVYFAAAIDACIRSERHIGHRPGRVGLRR